MQNGTQTRKPSLISKECIKLATMSTSTGNPNFEVRIQQGLESSRYLLDDTDFRRINLQFGIGNLFPNSDKVNLVSTFMFILLSLDTNRDTSNEYLEATFGPELVAII